MVYEWRTGSRIKGDATEIGAEIERLGDAVTPLAVVKTARSESSALHQCFEWDNTLAAEKFRLEQARGLMQALVVVVDTPGQPEDTVTIRAYESIAFEGEEADEGTPSTRAYVPIRKALSNKDMRLQIQRRLAAVITEAEETARKYDFVASARNLKRAREALKEK